MYTDNPTCCCNKNSGLIEHQARVQVTFKSNKYVMTSESILYYNIHSLRATL